MRRHTVWWLNVIEEGGKGSRSKRRLKEIVEKRKSRRKRRDGEPLSRLGGARGRVSQVDIHFLACGA